MEPIPAVRPMTPRPRRNAAIWAASVNARGSYQTMPSSAARRTATRRS